MTSSGRAVPGVAVLHPGRMGAAIARSIAASGRHLLYLPEGRSAATRHRAEQAGMAPAPSVEILCRSVDIIFSICAPEAAEDVAELVAEHRFQGIYVEANALSPARSARIRQMLPEARAFVDAAIFGPPPGDGRRTSLYLAGDPDADDAVRTVSECLTTGEVLVEHLDQAPPAASALKMAHSSYQKASRALAAVAHALASDYGVQQHLIAEADRNSKSSLAHPEELSGIASRAWRWAHEMRDVGRTLADVGLPNAQALASADVLDQWAEFKDSDPTIEAVLRRLRD